MTALIAAIVGGGQAMMRKHGQLVEVRKPELHEGIAVTPGPLLMEVGHRLSEEITLVRLREEGSGDAGLLCLEPSR